jgi:DNA-binding NtrC family response regulator
MEITPQENPSSPPLPTNSAPPNNHLAEFAQFVESASANAARITRDDRPETLRAWLDLAEAYRITQALRECGGNRSAAARLLGIGRRTLYAKMEKLGITPTWRMS